MSNGNVLVNGKTRFFIAQYDKMQCDLNYRKNRQWALTQFDPMKEITSVFLFIYYLIKVSEEKSVILSDKSNLVPK